MFWYDHAAVLGSKLIRQSAVTECLACVQDVFQELRHVLNQAT